MNNEQIEELRLEIVRQSHATHCRLIALVQMLIDRKILKGKEAEILKELGLRSEDLQQQDLNDARMKERVRTLTEAWSKQPKQ